MSTEWLKDYEIPLYSVEEQLMITEVLDRAGNIISSIKIKWYERGNVCYNCRK